MQTVQTLSEQGVFSTGFVFKQNTTGYGYLENVALNTRIYLNDKFDRAGWNCDVDIDVEDESLMFPWRVSCVQRPVMCQALPMVLLWLACGMPVTCTGASA